MTLGESVEKAVRSYLETYQTSWGKINGKILSELVDQQVAPNWQPKKAKTLRKPTMTDDAYLTELQGEPVAEGLDVRAEFARMSLWCKTNGKQPTRRRFTQWLLRASSNKIMAPKRSESPALPHRESPPNWAAWEAENMPQSMYLGKTWAEHPPYAQEIICKEMLAEQLRERSQA